MGRSKVQKTEKTRDRELVNKRTWRFELELSVFFFFFCWFVTVDCGEGVRSGEDRIVNKPKNSEGFERKEKRVNEWR